MSRSSVCIIVIVLLSFLVSFVEFYLNSIGQFETERTQSVWGLVFALLTIIWAVDDAKRQRLEVPFEFGFLMYMVWPLAFPYYLVSTRGVDGMVYLAGFLSLWIGPWLVGLVAYVYFY